VLTRSLCKKLVRLPGITPGPSTWQEDILLLNHSREIKGAGSVLTLPAHAISTKNKHLLVIYAIPTRGFTAAVSVFKGTPPTKPKECKFWLNTLGAHFSERWAQPTGREPRLSCANFSFVSDDIIEMSLLFRSQYVHLSSLHSFQSFTENKKPCLLCGKQGLEKFYGSSLTCLPPGYPNSFQGFVLHAIWIGHG
jgi:hypothetical protein